ncbi:MAG: hypothetical protein JWM98_2340 [Thermoleophilia bacterium]|nr:hypothetical protein [Thermoleophilia bacterium]
MAFERLQELGERAAGRVHSMRGGSNAPRPTDPNDPFGKPAVVEIQLFEDRPYAERETVAKERITLGVQTTSRVERVEATRRIEHVDVEERGPEHA